VGADEVITNRGFENIILTHLDFARTYPFDSVKEDCGDLVATFNPDPGVQHFTNIWINQSDFYDCGDDCISMIFLSASTRADVTISRNQFVGVNSVNEKALMLGLDDVDHDKALKLAVSLHQNRFYLIQKRLPLLTTGYLRAYNNVFEMWNAYGILWINDRRIMIENNVFRSSTSSLKDDAWESWTGSVSNVWARKNKFWTSAGTCPNPPGTGSTCETTSFPACQSLGGPWYYDCTEPMEDLSAMTYSTALSYLRTKAGWKVRTNDVRSAATTACDQID